MLECYHLLAIKIIFFCKIKVEQYLWESLFGYRPYAELAQVWSANTHAHIQVGKRQTSNLARLQAMDWMQLRNIEQSWTKFCYNSIYLDCLLWPQAKKQETIRVKRKKRHQKTCKGHSSSANQASEHFFCLNSLSK